MSMRRVVIGLAGASLAAAVLAPSATAGPQTKWYTDTVGSPTSSQASYIVFPPNTAETLVLQVNNDPSSNQSFGSADINLVNDWSWDRTTPLQITTSTGFEGHWTPVSAFDSTNTNLIHLRNNGTGSQYAVPPGGWLRVQLPFTTPAGGIDVPTFVVKQSNDFSDSSTRGTSNVFGQIAPAAAIYVGSGPPAKLVYGQAPSDVQVTTSSTDTHYMCPPVTAIVEDALNNVVSWLPATAVTLTSTGSPGLKLDGSTTLSANTSNGVATFGAGTAGACTGGLTASVQGSFDLTASTTWAAGAGYTSGSASTSAAPYTVYLTLCTASCDVPLSGDQTNAGIHATGGDGSPTPLIGLISAVGTVPAGCSNAHITYRPSQTTLFLDGHDKTVDIGWSKKITNLDPRNGTPFWPVCIVAPYNVYVSDGAGGVTTADATNGVILALCSTTGVGTRSDGKPDLPCVSNLYKNAASEHAVVWLPNIPGDPHFI